MSSTFPPLERGEKGDPPGNVMEARVDQLGGLWTPSLAIETNGYPIYLAFSKFTLPFSSKGQK